MRIQFLAAWLILAASTAEAQPLELGSPFMNGMVLQREGDVPVWGWAEPGSEISVEFAGQQKTTMADKNGRWMVKLSPLEASATGQEFMVQRSAVGGRETETVTLKGVLVGEVWFASGQSNMEWVAGKSMYGQLAGQIEGAPSIEFDQWPKSFEAIATQLGRLAAEKLK